MTLPYDKFAAVVVIPTVATVQRSRLRRWLARGSVRHIEGTAPLLKNVLAVLNLAYPESGLAALRMWGQTGDRPNVWLAAADPIYLEPRLDHLRLHALHGENMPSADLRFVFDALQATLASDNSDQRRYGFARIKGSGYVRAERPLATAQEPAASIDGGLPNEFMPAGDSSGSYRNLRSEVEMVLHDHEVNRRRAENGLPPVNSLWLWGGGYAPEQNTEPRPPLFASEPLLRGYWYSKTGVVADWPGSIAQCLDASVAGFVAVADMAEDDENAIAVETVLDELMTALSAKRVSEVVLLTGDGLAIRISPSDRWRIWRRQWPLQGTSGE
ncbi:MAG: hypothetical protein AAF351_12775 [Pseudomonadota bacterium]